MGSQSKEVLNGHPEGSAFVASVSKKGIQPDNAIRFANWLTSDVRYPNGLLKRLDGGLTYISSGDIASYQSGLAEAFVYFLNAGGYTEFDVFTVRPNSSQAWMTNEILHQANITPVVSYENLSQLALGGESARPIAIFDEWSVNGQQLAQQITDAHALNPNAPIFVGVGILGEGAQRRLRQLQQLIPNLHLVVLDKRVANRLESVGFTQEDVDFINNLLGDRDPQIELRDTIIYGDHKVSDTASFVLREAVGNGRNPILIPEVNPPYRKS